MSRTLLLTLGLGVVAVSWLAGPAWADRHKEAKDAKEIKEARRLLDEGDALLNDGHAEDALAKYQQAYNVRRIPDIYYPIATAEAMLGRHLDALSHFQQLLVEAGHRLEDRVREKAEQQIAELEQKIALVTFDVEPRGATVSMDEVELGNAPLGEKLPLMPGAHTYNVVKQGFKPLTKTITLKAGDRPTITVRLDAAPVGIDVVKVRPRRNPHKAVLTAGIVGTASLAVAGSITGFLAIQRHGEYNNGELPVSDREHARRQGKKLALATDILFVASAASLAFTTYWYLSKVQPAGRAERVPSTASTVMPYVSADGNGGGLVWTGRF